MGDLEEATIWYNDTVIYPDKVRLNKYLLSSLFLLDGYQDDLRHGIGQEDDVCGGGDMRFEAYEI